MKVIYCRSDKRDSWFSFRFKAVSQKTEIRGNKYPHMGGLCKRCRPALFPVGWSSEPRIIASRGPYLSTKQTWSYWEVRRWLCRGMRYTDPDILFHYHCCNGGRCGTIWFGKSQIHIHTVQTRLSVWRRHRHNLKHTPFLGGESSHVLFL